jgi:hypothetical protein
LVSLNSFPARRDPSERANLIVFFNYATGFSYLSENPKGFGKITGCVNAG